MTKLTIGMPVYNGAQTIGRALDSLLAQNSTDFLLIISDNASTDETREICQAYVARDSRVRYVRHPANLGAALNFRFVLFEASTPYFMWAAADDLWAPSFIERNLAVLDADPGVVLSQSRVLFVADGTPNNLSTGTFALPDDVKRNTAAYLTNPADNSRYYGIFRTSVLQSVFPARNFYALDWAVAAATLKFGTHHEISEVLMIRDTTDAAVYERGVRRDHRFWLWRVFPLLYMTIWLLAGRRVPINANVLYRLAKLNIYMHLRFGMYRWRRAADLYLANNSGRKTLGALFVPWVGRLCGPGLGRRLGEVGRRIRRSIVAAIYFVWRALPLKLSQREEFKRQILSFAGRLGYRNTALRERILSEDTDGTSPARMPSLPLFGWQMPRKIDGEAPVLSVVVVTADGVLSTLALVDSIARAQADMPIEVVLVDNGGTDVTGLVFGSFPGFTCCHFDRHVPFGVAANAGVHAALADTLVFVEPAVRVDPAFLRQIRAGLLPRTLVGPQLRGWDGFLDAAGGIVCAGSLPRGYGAGHSAENPAYLFSRDVDYCPGAFALRRETLSELGKFSGAYESFEVSAMDIATRLQAVGGRSRYWPAAIASDWSPAVNRRTGTRIPADAPTLIADWEKFAAANVDMLRRRADAERLGQVAHDRSCGKRLLFVDADTPRPDQSAGALLALNLMRILIDLGFRITFVAESNMAYVDGYTEPLQALGIEALYFPHFASVSEILEKRHAQFDVVMLSRAYIAERYIDEVRAKAPQARLIFMTHDLHFVREMREAQLRNDRQMLANAEATRASEFSSIAKADATIVVSTYEADIVRTAVPTARVHVVPLLFEVPDRPEPTSSHDRTDIIFVGSYPHPPNRDAVIYFAREIWPLVRQRLPHARFLVVGSGLTPDVRALVGDGVEVLGFVRDLDAVFATCRVSVAPLRFGAGVKGKVASSMLAGVPVVASSIAVEGTPLRDGVEVLVADTPEAFADAVVRVYGDQELRQRMVAAGFDFVRREYSIEVNMSRVIGVLEDAGVVMYGHASPPPVWKVA